MDLNPLIDNVVWPLVATIAFGIASAAITWAAAKFHQWTGIKIEANDRAALDMAIKNGIGLAIQKAGPMIGPVPKVSSGNPFMDIALQYVLRQVPDAVRRFDITPERIEQMILSRIPQVTGQVAPNKPQPFSPSGN